jgi:hypothetical protein
MVGYGMSWDFVWLLALRQQSVGCFPRPRAGAGEIFMSRDENENRSQSRMRSCVGLVLWLGAQAATLSVHLDELPRIRTAIDALENEAGRREATVKLNEMIAKFEKLGRDLRRAIDASTAPSAAQ